MSELVFHLTTDGEWRAAEERGVYRPRDYDDEGFVHCSWFERVEATARAYYRDTPELVVLAIDPAGLDVREEDGFPHLYGEVPVEAVEAVVPFPVNEPERCAECGFDGAEWWPEAAADLLDGLGEKWAQRIGAMSEEDVRRRPAEGVWSVLEYAAHSRDVTALVGWAMREVLEGRQLPERPGMEVDVDVAEQANYNRQDPATVLDELTANGQRVARHARRAAPGDWFRSSAVAGKPQTALDALRHIVHDASHHLMDVDRWKTTQSERR